MTTYKHVEAFCLMWYSCTCGHKERIWNSRDGVTPFTTKCPSCGQSSLTHSSWNLDVCAPINTLSVILHKHQKYWRDGTPDEAEAIMRKRIEALKDTYPCSPEKEAELIREAREGSDTFKPNEFHPGWPVLDVWKE